MPGYSGAETTVVAANATAKIAPMHVRQKYKRKYKRPSEDMHDPDGRSYRCPWIEDSITIHSDGNVSCGLDDPHAQRSFGNIKEDHIAQIFANEQYFLLKSKLAAGYKCKGCALYTPIVPEQSQTNVRSNLPSTIIVETTVRCNLRCPNDACIPNNDPSISTRDGDDLEVDVFKAAIQQLSNNLEKVYFFNYGDPFLHKNAEEMLSYLKDLVPNAEVVTSTNAIPLAKPLRAEKVIASNISHIVVTLSGIDQQSYQQYHKNGRVDLALQGLRNLCEARKARPNSKTKIIWRYLLFRWNDSREEIGRAVALSEELGVDQFSLYLTHFPLDSASFRFSPGSPNYKEFCKYIDLTHGYNAEAPGEDGFYGEETIEGIGDVRWTSSEALINAQSPSPFFKLSIAPMRGNLPEAGMKVVIRTPWATRVCHLQVSEFTEFLIRVPFYYRFKMYSVQMRFDDYWFPAEYSGSADLRCLGVLFKIEDNFVKGWKHELAWLRALPHAFRKDNSVARPEPLGLIQGKKGFAAGGRFEAFNASDAS